MEEEKTTKYEHGLHRVINKNLNGSVFVNVTDHGIKLVGTKTFDLAIIEEIKTGKEKEIIPLFRDREIDLENTFNLTEGEQSLIKTAIKKNLDDPMSETHKENLEELLKKFESGKQ